MKRYAFALSLLAALLISVGGLVYCISEIASILPSAIGQATAQAQNAYEAARKK